MPIAVPLNFALTATVQQPDVTTGSTNGNVRHITKPVRMTTQSLISLIQASLGTNSSANSTLVLISGTVVLQDKQGNQTDVSGFLSIDVTSGTGVVSGQESATGASNDTFLNYATVNFDDDNGNSFTLTGLARIIASSPGSGSNAPQAYSISFSGGGYGMVWGTDAVLSGTSSGKASSKH